MAIRKILDGKSYLSPEISDGIIRGDLSGVKEAKTETMTGNLTPREVEVL
jgi:DNA-binding NarL/FixJ family response regulator